MIKAETEGGYSINIPYTFHEYRFLKIIGHGSTSVVALVENENNFQLYAAKIIPKDYIKYMNLMENVQNEIKVMKEIDHPNIIKLHTTLELKNRLGESYIYLILDYCENGDLLTYITEKGFTNEHQKRKIIKNFLKGIKYLHDKGISHGDIKPENILLDEFYNPKITDFGYCRTMTIADEEDKKGTLNYAAPELFIKGQFNTLKSDIWAIGITLYILSEMNFPFKRGNTHLVIKQITSGELRINHNIPNKLRKLIKKCTNLIPMNRPTIDELINDDYFSHQKEVRN